MQMIKSFFCQDMSPGSIANELTKIMPNIKKYIKEQIIKVALLFGLVRNYQNYPTDSDIKN